MHPVSLFLESAYSFSGSNIQIETLVKDAKNQGYKTLVLTDKKMHGAYRFYTACKALKIKPIIGLQVTLEGIFHLPHIDIVCYAKNYQGYRNLLKLSSLQSYNNHIPISLFTKYHKDLSIVVYPYKTLWNDMSEENAEQVFHELSMTSEKLYIAKHPLLKEFTEKRIKTLPIDMVYYFKDNDDDLYDALRTVFQLEKASKVDNHFKKISEFTFSDKDLKELYGFMDAHEFIIDKKETLLPTYPNPHDLSSEAYLTALSERGLEKRLKTLKDSKETYHKRLKTELDTIISLGYADYFLIVWDVVRFAKKDNILVGPGRGSAPGSLVAYALGITDVDPIKHQLLFERFLNKDRINMPDIDIDFPDYAREKVIRYTEHKYGKEFVSHICTFGTFLKKSALRDTARVLNIETKYVNEMSRKIEHFNAITDMIETDRDVQNRMNQDALLHRWLSIAARVEGLPRHVSTHAAGIILSSMPIIDYTAIQPGLLGMHQTQFGQEDLEALGLLKMDFLGLRNLSMIENVLDYIEKDTGKRLNMYTLPLDDEKTYEMLRTKSTTGLFQLESQGMRKLIKDMQIRQFEDIVIVLALFRPGPMESKDIYLKRREGKAKVDYLTPKLEPILSSTQGILLYQEQIMAIASNIAGYTMNQADLLRRAVSKKDEDVLQAERQRFVEKSLEQGHSEALANEIYDYIVKFANYGFNKSHSVAYAMIAYWMAYLKAHYPAFFIAVLMQNALGNETLMKDYMQEAFTYNLELNGPNIQYSGTSFTLIEGALYYPLIGIKNIGKTLCKDLLEEREKGEFKSYIDFIHRTQTCLNTRSYQYLIYAGALDTFGLTRKTMIENIDAVQRFKEYANSIKHSEFVLTAYPEFEEDVLKRYEKEALGFLWMEDPLKTYQGLIKKQGYSTVKDLDSVHLQKRVSVIGYIARIKEIMTKKGDKMAFLTLSDHVKNVDAVVFPNTYSHHYQMIQTGAVYTFSGHLESKNKTIQFVINTISEVN